MITKCGTALFFGALAAFIMSGTVQAQAPGQGDPFTLHFDENGHGLINTNGGGNVPDPGFAAVDLNTGLPALTYALSEPVVPGGVNILENGHLSDALDFYNGGPNGLGFMAFYSGDLAGGQLADTISGGFVPHFGFNGATEVNDNFTYFPGGNEYFGVSPSPDGGSTLIMLSGAFALIGAFSRKLRKQ